MFPGRARACARLPFAHCTSCRVTFESLLESSMRRHPFQKRSMYKLRKSEQTPRPYHDDIAQNQYAPVDIPLRRLKTSRVKFGSPPQGDTRLHPTKRSQYPACFFISFQTPAPFSQTRADFFQGDRGSAHPALRIKRGFSFWASKSQVVFSIISHSVPMHNTPDGSTLPQKVHLPHISFEIAGKSVR